MDPSISVAFFCMPVLRTGLACMLRIHIHHGDAPFQRLVLDELLELVVTPTVEHLVISLVSVAIFPDAFQVFHRDDRELEPL